MGSGEEQVKYVRENFAKKYADKIASKTYDERDLNHLQSDDVYVTTFIRGPQRLDEAVDLVHESLLFRKEVGVNDITNDSFDQWVWDRQGIFLHNQTKTGHRILFVRVKEHKKDATLLPVVKKFFIFWLEKTFKENPLEGIVVLFDMSDAGLSNLDMELIRFILTCFKFYYPTLLEKLLIYEMPWIFNAAWKIIKTWLSQEAISKIKFMTKTDIQTYIDRSQLPEHMGGTDKFDTVIYCPASPEDTISKTCGSVSGDKKRVTFSDADSLLFRSFSTERMDSNINNSAASPTALATSSPFNNINMSAHGSSFTGRLLTISPAEMLEFRQESSNSDPYDTITLTNTLVYPIAFKIKTTAPEKYRVRPSTGVVRPGEASMVHVYLQPGYIQTISRDKFLVMAMEVVGDSFDKALWKQVPKDNIMEHRLHCTIGTSERVVQGYDVNVTVDGAGAGKASSKAAAAVAAVAAAAKSFSNTILNKHSTMNRMSVDDKLEMLIESNNQLRRRMGWLIISHIVFFIMTLTFFACFFCMGEDLFSSYLYFPFGYCMSATSWNRRC